MLKLKLIDNWLNKKLRADAQKREAARIAAEQRGEKMMQLKLKRARIAA